MRSKLFGLVLTLVLVLTLDRVTPAKASPCPGCTLSPDKTTATYSGVGSTCALAKNDWHSQAIAETTLCDSGEICPSSPTEVVTTSCFWDSSCGAYRESGYLKYRCLPVGCL
jgi:hypothetical protein